MIDYTQWQPKTVSVSSLLLDPDNPRIPPSESALAQDELLTELVEHDNVYDLAKRIVENGYYADESLITTPRADGKLVVIEGNRRLAAVKCLLSPDAVMDQYRQKFRALSAQIPKSIIKSVPVIVAPSRDEALPRIAEKHTRPLLEQWKPAQQARFYRSLVEGGKSVKEICASYGLTEGQLGEFLRMDILYRMACSLDHSEDVKKKVQNPRTFPITNLERLLESQPGREFLGVEIDPKYGFKGRVPVREFAKGFSKIVADVAESRVTSRDLNDIGSIKSYLKTLDAYKPDDSKRGSFKPSDIIKKSPSRSGETVLKRRKKGASRSLMRILPSDLKCGLNNQRIHAVFNELRRLTLADFPNAIAMMLRVLLELSVSHFIQQSGKTQDLLKKYKDDKRPRDWHPSLRQQLRFMLEEFDLRLEPLELKALRQFVNDNQTPMTLDSLDGFVHNKHLHPTETELRAIWGRIEPLLRIVLIEPTQSKN